MAIIISGMWLKLVSYAQVNARYRRAFKSKGRKQIKTSNSQKLILFSLSNDCSLTTLVILTILGSACKYAADQVYCYPNNLTLSSIFYYICIPYLCYESQPRKRTHLRYELIARELLQLLFWYEAIVNVLEYVIYPNKKAFFEGPSLYDINSTQELVDFIVFTACTIPVRMFCNRLH